MNKLTASLNTSLASLILRMLIGGLFVYYGYFKLANAASIMPVFPDPIGIGSRLSFFLTVFAELVCGFFVLVGLATRFMVIPILILMIVVFFIVHRNDIFTDKQIALVYLVLTVIILILGSGRYSLDYLLSRRKHP